MMQVSKRDVGRSVLRTVLAAVAVGGCAGAAWAAGAINFVVQADHSDCLYAVGETATFKVLALDANNAPLTSGTVDYRTHATLAAPPAYATHDLAQGNPFTVSGTLTAPGFLRLNLKAADGSAKTWGVAFDPQDVRPSVARPADFDTYWDGEVARLDREVPDPDVQMNLVAAKSTGDYNYYEISFATFGGGRVYGFYTEPKDGSKTYPAIVTVPGAGPNHTGSWYGSGSCVSLMLNALPFTPFTDGESFTAAYNEWNAGLQSKYELTGQQYGAAGIAVSREEFVFHDVILGMNRAVNWLAARPLVNKSRIGYYGGSQGGAFGLFLMGLNANFTRGVAYVPAMCDHLCCALDPALAPGWPQMLGMQAAKNYDATKANAPYFDGAFFAGRITCPVRMFVGLIDDTCPPRGGWCAYNALQSSDKSMMSVPGMTHACDTSLEAATKSWALSEAPARPAASLTAGDGTTFVVDGKVLTITVPDGAACTTDYSAYLADNTITNVVMKGPASGMASIKAASAPWYEGDFDVSGHLQLRIESVTAPFGRNYDSVAAGRGTVRAHDGATLYFASGSAGCVAGKTIVVSGAGCDGTGALQDACSTARLVKNCLIRLESDVAFHSAGSKAGLTYDNTFDVNGHVLTHDAGSTAWSTTTFSGNLFTNSSATAGSFVLAQNNWNYYLNGDGNTFAGGPANTLVFKGNYRYLVQAPIRGDWTLVKKSGDWTYGAAKTATMDWPGWTGNACELPVLIEGGDFQDGAYLYGGRGVTITGDLSGSGDIYIRQGDALHLGSKASTYAGTLTMDVSTNKSYNTTVMLMKDSVFKAAKVTVDLFSKQTATPECPYTQCDFLMDDETDFVLPPFENKRACGLYIRGGGAGTTIPSVTLNNASGFVRLDTPAKIAAVNVTAGALYVATDASGALPTIDTLAVADNTPVDLGGSTLRVKTLTGKPNVTNGKLVAESARQVYSVNAATTAGVDLLSMADEYFTDRIKWGANVVLAGPVTHAEATVEHPFTILGSSSGSFYTDTGLDRIPLRIATTGGTLTHTMRLNVGGVYTNAPGFAHLDFEHGTFATTTYCQWGDETGPRELVITNGCKLDPWTSEIGNGGKSGVIRLIGGSMGGAGFGMSTTADTLASTVTVRNAGLNLHGDWGAAGSFAMSSQGPDTGVGTAGDCNVVVLEEGGQVLAKGFYRKHDARGHFVFRGGQLQHLWNTPGVNNASANKDFFLENTGAGTLEFEAATGPFALDTMDHDVMFIHDYGTVATTLLSGTCGFAKRGTGKLTLNNPQGRAVSTMTGGVTVEAGTLALGADSFLCAANPLVVARGASFDLNGHAAAFTTVTGAGEIGSSASGGSLAVGGDGSSFAFGPKLSAGARLVKEGAGTLSLAAAVEGGDLTVRAGTVDFAGTRPRGYRHYRFKVDKPYKFGDYGMQFSEVKLLDGETDVTPLRSGVSYAAYRTTYNYPPDMTYYTSYGGEIATQVYDGNLGTKWLDYRARADRIETEGDELYVQFDYASDMLVTAYSWATANDGGPSADGRDPASWRLLASDDGENWVELDKRENMGPYATRKAWVGEFAVTYPAERYLKRFGDIVVESGATLDLRGTVYRCNSLVNRGGTVLTDDGTVVISADAGEEIETVVAGSSIAADVVKTGLGTNTLVGTYAVDGSFSVTEGTVRCLPYGFGGKYFRLTIAKNRDNVDYTQFCEFYLYDADGNVIDDGRPYAKRADGTDPADLAEKQVAQKKAYAGTGYGETIDWAFDGLLFRTTNGSCLKYLCAQKPTADEPIVFYFRMPAATPRVHGYNFIAGNDSGGARNPVTWTFEGSSDGVNWTVLDEQTNAATPSGNTKRNATTGEVTPVYFNGGVPYATANAGDPAADDAFPFGPDAAVAVAADATLDFGSAKMTLTHLAVDAAACGGTLTRFTPAPDGVLDLTLDGSVRDFVGERGVTLLAVPEIAARRNLVSWRVRVNGVPDGRLAVRWSNGKLLLIWRPSAVLVVR